MTYFGRDTSCTTSLKPGRYVTGARLVAEAAYRRLSTPRGMLRGGEAEANYGLDLQGLVGAVATPSQAAALPGQIENELKKDERINSVAVTVTKSTEGPGTAYTIRIGALTDDGPFELVIGVSDVTTELLGLTAEG